MSETVSTGSSPAPSQGSSGTQTQSTPSTQTQQSSGSQTTSFGQSQAAPTRESGNQTSGNPQGFSEGAPQEAAPAPRKLGAQDLDALVEVKIDGKLQEMPLKEVIRLQQLEKASRQKMSEAHRAQQEAQRLHEMAKNDPERYLKEVLGLDPDTYAEERLARKYELSQMSPEARRAMELEQQLSEVQTREQRAREPVLNDLQQYVTPDEFKQIQEQAKGATLDQLQRFAEHKRQVFQQGVDNTSNELLQAWEKTGLPRQKDFGAWIAQVMVDHQKRSNEHKKRTGEDLPPLQPDEAAVKVKQRFLNSTRSLFGQMDAKAIQEALGPEIIQKLRSFDVDQVSKPQAPPWAPSEQQTLKQPDNGKKYMNEIEYRQWLKS